MKKSFRNVIILFIHITYYSYSQENKFTHYTPNSITAPIIENVLCGKNNQTSKFTSYLNANLYDEANAIIEVEDGYIVGATSDSDNRYDKTSLNFGYDDFWVIKFDKQGNKIWEKVFGGTNRDEVIGILKTPDNAVVVAGNSGSGADGNKTEPSQGGLDFWIVKIDYNGNKIFDRRYGGNSDDILKDVKIVNNGVLLLGWSYSDINGDKTSIKYGHSDYWVVKVGLDGNKIWDKTFGGSGDDFCNDALILDNQDIMLIGSSYSTNNGNKTSINYGSSDIWTIKINENGDKLWEKTYGGSSFDAGFIIYRTPDGGYILGGQSMSFTGYDKSEDGRGANDYWILKISVNGNKLWDKTLGGSGDDYIGDLLVNEDGSIIVGGFIFSGPNGDVTDPYIGQADVWLIKLNNSGSKVWDKRYGSGCVDALNQLHRDSDGSIIIVGKACYNVWLYKFDECQASNRNKVCQDEQITLRATGCTNGSIVWSNSLVGKVINIIPQSSENYSATCLYNGESSFLSNVIYIELIKNILTLSGTPSAIEYLAKNEISSNQLLTTSTIYKAGNSIKILPGFECPTGTTFISQIQNVCPN